MTSHQSLHEDHVLLIEIGTAVFGALHSRVHVIEAILEGVQPRFDGVGHRFNRRTGRRAGRYFGRGEGVSVNERVPRGASLDFSQPHQIPSLEVAVAVLELPEWGVGGARLEDIADCGTSQRRLRAHTVVLSRAYLCESRTCSTVGRKRKRWYA